jgi:tetratricopeptide (TPR) repeat protein
MAHAPADASRNLSATDRAARAVPGPASRPCVAAADPRAALEHAARLLEQARGTGRPGLMAEACHRVAHCWRALGERSSALDPLERALQWARASGACDQALDLQCELAELLAEMAAHADHDERGSGRALRERARDEVFDAVRAATGCADPRWEVTLLLRLSDVLDRFGDRDDATQLQVRALQLTAAGMYGSAALRAEDAAQVRRH